MPVIITTNGRPATDHEVEVIVRARMAQREADTVQLAGVLASEHWQERAEIHLPGDLNAEILPRSRGSRKNRK